MKMARDALLRDSFRNIYNDRWKDKVTDTNATSTDMVLEIKCLTIHNDRIRSELTTCREQIDRLKSNSYVTHLENELREKTYQVTKLQYENRNLKRILKRSSSQSDSDPKNLTNNNLREPANATNQVIIPELSPVLVFEIENIYVKKPTGQQVCKHSLKFVDSHYWLLFRKQQCQSVDQNMEE